MSVTNTDALGNPVGEVTYVYDDAKRLVEEHQNGQAVAVHTLDHAGNRKRTVIPTALDVQRAFDPLHRVSELLEANFSLSASYGYDESGRLTSMTKPDGTVSTYTYDDAGQLLQIRHSFGELIGAPSESLQLDYTFNTVGNITGIDDSRMGANTFTYDAIDQLTAALRPPAAPVPDESYAYDPVGNRLTSHRSASHTHNAANRLTQDDDFIYDYDVNGNRTVRMDRVTGAREEYSHDVENRLLGYKRFDTLENVTAQARYVYDGLDRRIAKIVDGDGDGPNPPEVKRFFYDGEDIVREETCAYAGSLDPDTLLLPFTNCTPTGRWLHGPGIDDPLALLRDRLPPVGVQRDDGLFYQDDHLGSIQTLTTVSGSVFAQYYYDSFGNLERVEDGTGTALPPSELVAGNFHTYTGRELDPESLLYYYRARYYDPGAGRFLEEDPIFSDNLYPYVGNDPVNSTDPFGEAVDPNEDCEVIKIGEKGGKKKYYKCEDKARNTRCYIPFGEGETYCVPIDVGEKKKKEKNPCDEDPRQCGHPSCNNCDNIIDDFLNAACRADCYCSEYLRCENPPHDTCAECLLATAQLEGGCDLGGSWDQNGGGSACRVSILNACKAFD